MLSPFDSSSIVLPSLGTHSHDSHDAQSLGARSRGSQSLGTHPPGARSLGLRSLGHCVAASHRQVRSFISISTA